MYYIRPIISVEELTIDSIRQFNPGKKILIISSGTVYKNHNLGELFEQIAMAAEVHIYTHVRPDAPFEDLDLILSDFDIAPPDFIIAIGGGSVIDAAKTLSIAFNGTSYKDIFYGRETVPQQKIRLLAVPTTAGTGAELSFGAIIYDKQNKRKGGIRGEIIQPDYVIIDAGLHNKTSFKLKAEVGFDCLTHAVETYISKKSSPMVRMQSISCIRVVLKHLVPACKTNSFDDMEKIAIASTMMGANLAYSSTCLPHRIQYVIGPMTGTSHAQGLIALYRGWLKYLHNSNNLALTELANELDMSVPSFLEKIQSLKTDLSIDYDLKYLGLNKNQIQEITENVTGNVHADPSYIDKSSIRNILELALV